MELGHRITQRLTHPSNLPILAFGEGYRKASSTYSLQFTGESFVIADIDPTRHPMQKNVLNGLIDLNQIFFFMSEFSSENTVYDIPIISEKNQARRIFI